MEISLRDVLIVLPALNEADTLANVISEIQTFAPGINCLVVSDGSTDKTADVAIESGAILLDLPYNLGVGGAMRAGFRFAVRNNYKVVVQVDSDGQHDPRNIMELISNLDFYDLVIGARFAGKGAYRVRGARKFAMKSLSGILSNLAKTKLTDTTSGFRAFGINALQLYAKDFPAEYLGDTVEAIVIAAKNGLKITQIPVEMRVRQGGNPSQNPAQSALYLGRVYLALGVALLKPIRKESS